MAKDIESIELEDVSGIKSRENEKSVVKEDFSLIGHVKAQAEVVVGTVELAVEKLFNLKPGDVVAMNEKVNSEVTLMIDKKAVAKGVLIVVDDHFGLEVTETL